MQKAEDTRTVEEKVSADEGMIARLMENNPVEEEAAAKKQGRPKGGVGRLAKVLASRKPRQMVIAVGTHVDPVTGKKTTTEIKATLPPEKPAAVAPPVFYTKTYNVVARGQPVEINKTFGPNYSNRRQRRAMNKLVAAAMSRKKPTRSLLGLDVA